MEQMNDDRSMKRLAKVAYPTLFGCDAGAGGRVVVFGVPYDRGTDNIPGAADAPALLRDLTAPQHNRVARGALLDLATGATMFEGKSLSDLGDLKYRPTHSDDDHLAFVARAAQVLAAERKATMVLGGDHLITLAVLRGIARERRPFQVVHLDAHFDYGDVKAGERPTHGSFMSFVAAERLAVQVVQVGVRGYFASMPAPIEGIRQATLADLGAALLPDVDVYLTVDTDAFDPLWLPAVSYPVPRGLAPADIATVLEAIGKGHRRLVGADWTEYNPRFDTENNITGRIIVDSLVPILAQLIADTDRA